MTHDQKVALGYARAALAKAEERLEAAIKRSFTTHATEDFEYVKQETHTRDCCRLALRIVRSRITPKPRRKHSRFGSIRCDICAPLRCTKAK